MKIGIAIIEDEPMEVVHIHDILDKYQISNSLDFHIDTYNNAHDFLIEDSRSYDLAIMDIDLPGINGMEAARVLRNQNSHIDIIFVTNLAQFAIKGYEVEALDYMLKPIKSGDFFLKMDKFIRRQNSNINQKIKLPSRSGSHIVNMGDVQYVEVINHNLDFHMPQRIISIRGKLRDWEPRLPPNHFFRINNSYIVNLNNVRSMTSNSITLNTGLQISISRKRKEAFKVVMARFLGTM